MPKVLLFLLIQIAASQKPELIWESFQAPEYPRNAQIAHISGPIAVEFTLNEDGTGSIGKVTGHPLLAAAAVESIKASRFRCSHCGRESAFTVEFNFGFAEHTCEETKHHPAYTAALKDANDVSVIAEPVCTEDPGAVYAKVRSVRCLYLWKCGKIWLQ
jgi:hypothetical protein